MPEIYCEKKCQSNYNMSYEKDKHFGGSYYIIPPEVEAIQEEIMTYGPVMADIQIYADFRAYKSGVYRHGNGTIAGAHTLKILGWGVDTNSPYWL